MLGALVDAHDSASGGALLAELARVRRQGWAIAEGELPALDIKSLAVPCAGPNGEVLFAVSVSGPASRLPASRRSAVVAKLKVAADKIAARPGLHHPPPAHADEDTLKRTRQPRTPRRFTDSRASPPAAHTTA